MKTDYKPQISQHRYSESNTDFLKMLYSGILSLSVQAKTIRLLLATLLMACQLSAIGQTIQNNVFWKDTDGNPIYSQGGGTLKVGDTYYWYGAKYNGAITYYNNPSAGKNSDTRFLAITCYSSKDLVNWKNEGDVLTAADIPGSIYWVGRVGAAYNANTRQYVVIAQLNGGLLFATKSTPNGRFTFRHTQQVIDNVVNDMSGDQSVYTDSDGKAYLVYSNREGRSNLYVSPLRASDYLYVEPGRHIYRSTSGGREGSIMFKQNGTYYFCSSDLHGWNTSKTYVISATNIFGPYSSEYVMQNTDKDYSHVTQCGLALEVKGTNGSFVIFGGDRWADFAGNGIGYNQWLPITFNGTTPIFHSVSQWNINAAAGTWSVGSGNNYVMNPNIEADRISVQKMVGWTNWTNLTNGNPNGNTSGSRSPGRWAMSQYNAGAYQARISQIIAVPNGTYTLSAWVKSSGGQSSANVYARNFGGTEMNAAINRAIGSWTQVTIPNINVTNGSVEIGVFSNANAGNWVNVDDFILIGSSSPCNPTAITPYVQIDGGAWTQTSIVSINAGQTVKLGPNPVSGGSWSWTGCGTSGSSREQTISPASSCTATATYTNTCGATSSQMFTITVQGTPTNYSMFQNRATGLQIDGMSRTANGSNAGQYAASGSDAQQWLIETVGSYVKLRNKATGLYLDGMGRTTNGSICGQYASGTSYNQQWTIEIVGSYSKLRNRGTGLYVDGMGRTTNGSDLGQYASGTSYNQQWTMSTVSSTIASTQNENMTLAQEEAAASIYPNPTGGQVNITLSDSFKTGENTLNLLDVNGKSVISEKFRGIAHSINMGALPEGIYVLRVGNDQNLIVKKVIKK